ncbi:MAG TPA: hypothetical protein VJM33_13025 [Microthrixaceae bacterium]|nr:hypothetical protein [Microthrixaceae bacterium]
MKLTEDDIDTQWVRQGATTMTAADDDGTDDGGDADGTDGDADGTDITV